jgi:hypothetical protein
VENSMREREREREREKDERRKIYYKEILLKIIKYSLSLSLEL